MTLQRTVVKRRCTKLMRSGKGANFEMGKRYIQVWALLVVV